MDNWLDNLTQKEPGFKKIFVEEGGEPDKLKKIVGLTAISFLMTLIFLSF